jgi:hypothetical protein
LGVAGMLISEEKFSEMLHSSVESTMRKWKAKAEGF